MRVITGIARGRRLETLEGEEVRPTTDRVKEAMFSSIQFDLQGARVLDLFAGSGQLGIEAISRGARECVFLDQNAKAIAVIEENIKQVGFESMATVLRQDSLSYLKVCRQNFDIALLDPPYRKGILTEALPLLSKKMNNGGKILCECEENFELPEKVEQLVLKKVHKYGKIKVGLYEVEDEEQQ